MSSGKAKLKNDAHVALVNAEGQSSSLDAESSVELPVTQSRFLSFLVSKKVPPVPTEEERILYPANPRNILKYTFFWWINPLYVTGYKRTVDDADIYKFPDDMKVGHNNKIFRAILERRINAWKEKNPEKGNEWPLRVLLLSLFETFSTRVIMSVIFSLFYVGLLTGNPMVTKKLVNFVEERLYNRSTTSLGPGIGYSFLNVILSLITLLCMAHNLDLAYKVGIDVKSILIKNVFEKSIKLTPSGKAKFPISKLTTMIGSDLARLEFSFQFVFLSLGMVLGAIASVALLIYNIGVSALAGIGVLVVCSLFQGLSSRLLYKFRVDLNQYTDARVGLVREMVNSFKTIKYYCWENPYFERIRKSRNHEMKVIMKMKLVRAASESASLSLPTVSTMVSFLVLYKIKGISNVAAIFSSLSLFSLLGIEADFLPLLLSSASDALFALNGIVALLRCDEEDDALDSSAYLPPLDSSNAIEVINASFTWETLNKDTDANVGTTAKEEGKELQSIDSNAVQAIDPSLSIPKFMGFNDVNLSIKKGEFVVVSGLIGSGKTSLLSALSGIMKKTSGDFNKSGSTLFCGTPWVQNATVRDNILFGSPYDESRYREVLFACALLDDIKLFQGGDLTEIGERGVNLSGGQKARISLARAVYADKDILLLDDVLSAVDAKVGRHIVIQCFLGLLRDKTKVLATHQLSLISSADSIIFLSKNGTITQGTSENLQNNSEYVNLLSFSADLTTSEKEEEKKEAEVKQDLEESGHNAGEGLLIIKETKAVNHLSWDVYKSFITSGETGALGVILALVLVIFLIFGTFTAQFINVWLSFWSDRKFESLASATYVGIYVMFNLVNILFSFGQLSSLSWVVNNASKSLVIGAVRRLLHAPMSFMDTTPVGRILNRFTKDTDVLDNEVYQNLLLICTEAAKIFGSFVLTMVYLPWIALSVPPLLLACFCVTDFSQSTARETKRIEAIRRSFVFDNINEALGGLSTIKAYKAEQMFIRKNEKNLNRDNEAHYVNFTTQRWLTLHLTLLSCLYSLLVVLLAVTGVFHTSPASTGLLLNAVYSFSEALSLFFRSTMMLENSMNSAERLYQYAKQLEQEAPFKISEYTPNPKWPANPSIEFDNVSLSYRPGLPLVLKNVSFQVKGAEKIGICGRTGAGKSSIMTALYRISELSSGKIVIDGLDIGKMGLQDLRSKLNIIPQDTVLFKGSIRYNLDPFGNLPDSRLLSALEQSGLYKEGESSKFGLDLMVEDDGINYSLGEKQLIALARALARDANILILDEATSSVDYETDSKIQNTIKTLFGNCTILCIAHRLKTILDYDKILVLDAGEVKEFDTPFNLFNMEKGIFRDMCERSNITDLDFKY